jgi:predicted NodU family carbamoyl transferase
MAIHILLVALAYSGIKRLTTTIQSLGLFYKKLIGYLGFDSSEIKILVDKLDDVQMPHSSETVVEQLKGPRQRMENIEVMVASSKQGDCLLYFLWVHGNDDGMDFGPMNPTLTGKLIVCSLNTFLNIFAFF